MRALCLCCRGSLFPLTVTNEHGRIACPMKHLVDLSLLCGSIWLDTRKMFRLE